MRNLSVSTSLLIVVELALFMMLWLFPNMNTAWLLAHSVVSLFASYWLSHKWKTSSLTALQTWLILLIFLLFLPIIGAIILGLINKKFILKKTTIEPTIEKKESDDNSELHYFSAPKHHYSGHLKKARNMLSTLDDNAYLRLLIASRHLPDKEAYTLLKEALSSPFESARLMAFSLKGKVEERLQDDIHKKLSFLKNSPQQRTSSLHLSISKDYMHLCDIGVLSESKENLLRQARQHCINAIRLNNKSSAAFQHLGKILKLQGKYKQAQHAHTKAITLR